MIVENINPQRNGRKLMNNISERFHPKENEYYKTEIKEAISEFMTYTQSEDFMGIILRAQIYIEKDLNALIEKLVISPRKIKLQFFSAKLDAAYALGAIDQEWYGAFNKFNKIRNKYAHDYGYEFKQSDYDELISTLSKGAKEEFKTNLELEQWFISILNSIKGTSQEIDLKYKLRVLLSDFMLHIKQQNQSFEILWDEINITKKAEILERKIALLKQLGVASD